MNLWQIKLFRQRFLYVYAMNRYLPLWIHIFIVGRCWPPDAKTDIGNEQQDCALSIQWWQGSLFVVSCFLWSRDRTNGHSHDSESERAFLQAFLAFLLFLQIKSKRKSPLWRSWRDEDDTSSQHQYHISALTCPIHLWQYHLHSSKLLAMKFLYANGLRLDFHTCIWESNLSFQQVMR